MNNNGKNNSINKNTVFEWIAAALVIFVMVVSAEVFKEREIIFPEIAAISIGYLMTPKRFWMVNSTRMVVMIGICSTIGVMIVRWGPSNIWLQVLIAFALGQLLLFLSRTSFSPMISAIVLPVILATDTWVYPFSAIVLTIIIVLFRECFMIAKIKEKEEFIVENNIKIGNLARDFVRLIAVGIFSFIMIRLGLIFAIAPPLLVYFVEFTNKAHVNRDRVGMIKACMSKVIFIVSCATIGAFSRILLCEMMDFSIVGIALVQIAILIGAVQYTRIYLPPAGALMILSLLIPYDELMYYPFQIALGVMCLTIMGIAIKRIKFNSNKYLKVISEK